MNIAKKIELIKGISSIYEEDRQILDEFYEIKKEYDNAYNKIKLNNYDYDVKYFEAKRAVDSMIDENALNVFYETYVPKKYFNDLEVKLNSIYNDMKKNYEIGNRIKLEEKISDFKSKQVRIEKEIHILNSKLVLGSINDLNVTEAIVGLGIEVDELKKSGEKILEEMREFEISINSSDFSISPSEINNKIKEFTFRCKELKIMHQNKYNARVRWTNKKIEEYRTMVFVDDEVRELVDRLSILEESNSDIDSYTNNKYSKMMDYNKLIEVNNLIVEIENKLQLKNEEVQKNLDANIDEIEKLINDLDKNQNFTEVENLMVAFGQLLGANNKVSNYNDYKTRLDNASQKLNEIRNRIVYENTYKEFDSNIKLLSLSVNNLDNMIDSLKGKIDESGQLELLNMGKEYKNRLETIKKDLESKKNSMDINQYNSLMNKLVEIEKNLDVIDEKVNHPEMIKDADIFDILNKKINELGISINELDSKIANTDKFSNREDRKDIDGKLKELEDRIVKYDKWLNENKDENIEKYNFNLEELNKLKVKFNELNGEYRKKCPLLVRGVKSAKNFFKKHKKACLIIAGIAAMSLVSYHVLIPAIMHGNIMIAGTTPALRPFIKFTNNILGGIIGATKDSVGLWTLKNGVCINPSCAASSLLKGLAISGVYSTPYVAALVIAIKKLVEKMKKAELKVKLSEGLEKGKEKVKNTTNNAVEKVKNIKTSIPKNYDKLCKEYIKSGMSLEEFCKEYGLNEKEMEIIKLMAIVYEENKSKKRGK